MNARRLEAWEFARNDGPFRAAAVPCTVAGLLRDRGEWALGDAADFDAEHWTFRCQVAGGAENLLVCDGLTPGAQIFLNGTLLATADNMFRALRLPVALDVDNLIEIRFSPLLHPQRKPRPRWRTQLVDQQWRWYRTTALGHMPSWGPLYATVGPWRSIKLERRTVDDVCLDVTVDGTTGLVTWSGRPIDVSRDSLLLAGERVSLSGDRWSATVQVRDVARWWPHTHGGQSRYRIALESGAWQEHIAFRSIERTEPFGIRINDVDIFCRGACWVPSDPIGFAADPRRDLELARGAHMNMLRLSGNTIYESDAFYEACDELGLMVWQDFMFASLDYPFADATFAASARGEAIEFLRRTQARACITALCGNSEVEMQALYVGQPIDTPAFYAETLRDCVADVRRDVPYVAGTPGGSFPVVLPKEGTSHYYGVGLFQRPLSDARFSAVRFAPECLAFAQRPSRASQSEWRDVPWSDRITRIDSGIGDFEATHWYYARAQYGLDHEAATAQDPALWEAVWEALPGEVMSATFGEWRATEQCRGALVWLWRDTWASTGLGLLDAAGREKAAMHYLRRALAPRAVVVVDEGLNGLALHLLNEGAHPVEAMLTLDIFANSVRVEQATATFQVSARGHLVVSADTVLGRHADLQAAYRLAAPLGDLVVVRWGNAPPAFFFPTRWPRPVPREVGLTASRRGNSLSVRTRDFVHTVVVEGGDTEDNYFHLAPGEERILCVREWPVTVSALGANGKLLVT